MCENIEEVIAGVNKLADDYKVNKISGEEILKSNCYKEGMNYLFETLKDYKARLLLSQSQYWKG